MRRRLPATVAALLAWQLAALSAFGAGPQKPCLIRLKEHATVNRQVIRLGDVAELGEGAGPELACLPLGNAPWPGRVRSITRALVMVRIASSGLSLDRFELAGSDACQVELATRKICSQRIVEAARRCLLAALHGAGRPEVELVRPVADLAVQAAADPVELRASLSGSGLPAGRVRVDVDLLSGGARLRRVPVSFDVRLFAEVAVAVRRIERGEPLTERNVVFAERDVTAVRGGAVTSRAELRGMVAACAVEPGRVLTRRMLRRADAPVVVDYNQRVFLVVTLPTLRAVTLGKALCRARQGEPARAVNLATGREVVGIAVSPGTIQVPIGGASNGR